jgi:tetratricopeptide (TPR) repeat protein
MLNEAISEFTLVGNLPGGNTLSLSGLAYAHAVKGNRKEAEKYLDEMWRLSKQNYMSPSQFAPIYAVLGDKDKAFELLEEANKQYTLNIVRMRRDPQLASLRSDPRFDDLVRRIGFP